MKKKAREEGWRWSGCRPISQPSNPVEMVWNHTKYSDLANFLPEDVHALRRAVSSSIQATRSTGAKLIRAFFAHAGLTL